jgi:hypothetical protein
LTPQEFPPAKPPQEPTLPHASPVVAHFFKFLTVGKGAPSTGTIFFNRSWPSNTIENNKSESNKAAETEMAHEHVKTSGMAAIVLSCALGLAQAADPYPPLINPSQLRTLLKLKPGEPIPPRGGGRLTPGPSLPVGWNFEICRQSSVGTDGSNIFVFALNGDGTLFFDSSRGVQTSVQAQLLAACQHAGGGYFVHIINPATNDFDDLAINYP